jgi:uncharacterized membrane protein
MRPLIAPEDTWTLWAVIIGGTGAAIWLEQTYRWAAKASAPLLALGLAMVLSNTGVMPMESPVYRFVSAYLVPIALSLLLFRANVFRIVRTTGWMFAAFHISSLGTILGAIVATLALRGRIADIERAAGVMTASYLGGSINFFAVKESYHLSETIANPLLVADNFVMAAIFVTLLTIASSRFFLRRYPHPHSQDAPSECGDSSPRSLAQDGKPVPSESGDKSPHSEAARNLAAEHWRRKGIGLLDIAKGLAFALAAVAGADRLGRLLGTAFGVSSHAGLALQMVQTLLTNPFVLITAVSLAMATIFHRQLQSVNGPEEIGGYMLYLFLFTIGLPADLAAVLWNVPLLFVFCGIIAVINVVVTLSIGKLLGFGLEELLLCINANLGGPSTSAAMAISRGWSALVLPAILVGIWGYAIGTFVGILVAETLMRM